MFKRYTGTASAVALAVSVLFVCQSCREEKGTRFGVSTQDIGNAIREHIESSAANNGGKFKLTFQDRELELKLVRIHFEYLAVLTRTLHFACVDLVGDDGEFYDVDFYLKGRPGSMTVTETTVHKVNGQPLYLWEQKQDKTWERVPVDGASHQLLGIIKGRDRFEFTYEATLPEISGDAHIWLPVPQSDAFQQIDIKEIAAPAGHKIVKDVAHGNQVLYMALGPKHSGKTFKMVFDVDRKEKAAYEADLADPQKYLGPDRMVPADERFKKIVDELVADKKTDLARARALYDNVIDHMRYMKYGEGWGKGDAVYACNSLYGNCTDFHSYFIALARAAGIPARFAIGAAVPSERDEGGVDGYHCWAEFYAEGKWWPVDISEGNKFTGLSMYYFGHHPANRVEFTQGRDLQVDPSPQSGPINFLAYPLLEVAGEPVKVPISFTFRRTVSPKVVDQG